VALAGVTARGLIPQDSSKMTRSQPTVPQWRPLERRWRALLGRTAEERRGVAVRRACADGAAGCSPSIDHGGGPRLASRGTSDRSGGS
jgi:hypothetical protein